MQRQNIQLELSTNSSEVAGDFFRSFLPPPSNQSKVSWFNPFRLEGVIDSEYISGQVEISLILHFVRGGGVVIVPS